MRTFKLTIAYDGTAYCGWQVQANKPTLQATFAAVVRKVVGPVKHLSASGRTDSGVHALGQVVSFCAVTRLAPEVLCRALNAELPDDIVVLSAIEAPANFHARRDAIKKRYRYIVTDGPTAPVFERRFAWHCYGRLDEDVMRRASQVLVGKHDFSSFETPAGRRRSPIRTVLELSVERGRGVSGPNLAIPYLGCSEAPIIVEIEGDGFLYNMVRVIVGTLVDIGRGHRPVSWIDEVLAARDRRLAGQTAPAHGLYLLSVGYPETI